MLLPEHMTEDELRAWGRQENGTRLREIIEFPEHAATRAALRRNYASLTHAQAAWAVGQAQKEAPRNEEDDTRGDVPENIQFRQDPR